MEGLMNKTEKEKPEGAIFFEGVMSAMQEVSEMARRKKEYDEAIEKEVLRRIENNEFSSEQLLEIYKINSEAIKRSGVDLTKVLSPAIDAMVAAQQGKKPEQAVALDGLRQLNKVMNTAKKEESDDYNPSSSDVCEDYGPGGFSPVD